MSSNVFLKFIFFPLRNRYLYIRVYKNDLQKNYYLEDP